ncbi:MULTISPECIES: PAS domain S-box protein [unclassified Chelatococcus]|uniref:PAS domain S-box protein n=1 Tax=unclassified Chelatococcus TaxID=2638111 RepID=UPI001BCD87A3|nr:MULTISPECIES: PAS domain S-box protein [unclassified Chelatococcus]MBS7741687.1 PAS domain S-box protein [Chelatococcus sp. HY11]MBX3544294.1 PAS domain S-box protein [Chelatococcus sp.]
MAKGGAIDDVTGVPTSHRKPSGQSAATRGRESSPPKRSLSKIALRDSSLTGLSTAAILDALPEAIYTTDAAGRIVFHNKAATELWGTHPKLGQTRYCGSVTLYTPQGSVLPHDRSPLAVALQERRANRGHEMAVERPDGTRVPVLAFPTPLFDEAGDLIGAVNMLVDLSDRKLADEDAQRYAAIVESSEDAILAKDLDGTIVSWNRGAERLFGYTADETVGRPVMMLIPLDRQDEEPRILARIRAGERIDHFETVRRRKDGSLIEISLTISPVKDASGRIIGASKIARDITERRRAEEQQHLLIREMDHRVKNLFTLACGLVSLSTRSAASASELSRDLLERLTSLARAHALTVPQTSQASARTSQVTTLHALISAILAPYDLAEPSGRPRTAVHGDDITIAGGAVTSFALLLHEFATNAAKYGALSTPMGTVTIDCAVDETRLCLTWTERGGPPTDRQKENTGFGYVLTNATVRGQLGGDIERDWQREGLSIRLTIARERLSA